MAEGVAYEGVGSSKDRPNVILMDDTMFWYGENVNC